MATLDGGVLVCRSLQQHGITHVFGLGGGHINPTWWAAPAHGITIVDVRHEAAAAHAAEGWALATGRPGVCLVTAGPGLTNALTGVATAHAQGSPIVVIAGSATVRGRDSGEVEVLDQLSLVRPITKWARQVHHLDQIPQYLEMAFREAVTGRPGPCYVEIPIDVIHASIDERDVTWPVVVDQQRLVPPIDVVERAAAVLRAAERPAVVAGSGVWWSHASEALLELVERGIPVVTRQAGRGTVPDDHPLCFGRDWQNVVSQADTLLVVGKQLDYFFGYGQFPHLRDLIQIDIHPSELGRNAAPVTVPMLGDAGASLAAVAALVPKLRTEAWVGALREQADLIAEAKAVLGRSDAHPIHPMRLCAEVAARLGEDATVVGDASNMLMWADASFTTQHPGHLPAMGNLGTIGHGVCYALAAGLARPGSPVVWMVGDGSFGFNCMELDTAARFGVPIVVVVMNNCGWSAAWVPLGVRHYERMAGAFDGQGWFVDRAEEIGPALDGALASGAPAIVNVMLDPAAEYFPGRHLA
jgi:acetolactate synthase-1/2/3 large subunit